MAIFLLEKKVNTPNIHALYDSSSEHSPSAKRPIIIIPENLDQSPSISTLKQQGYQTLVLPVKDIKQNDDYPQDSPPYVAISKLYRYASEDYDFILPVSKSKAGHLTACFFSEANSSPLRAFYERELKKFVEFLNLPPKAQHSYAHTHLNETYLAPYNQIEHDEKPTALDYCSEKPDIFKKPVTDTVSSTDISSKDLSNEPIFNDEEQKQIQQCINKLDQELAPKAFKFFTNTGLKQEKKAGLEALLANKNKLDSKDDLIKAIEKTHPRLRQGHFSGYKRWLHFASRTDNLLQDLTHSSKPTCE